MTRTLTPNRPPIHRWATSSAQNKMGARLTRSTHRTASQWHAPHMHRMQTSVSVLCGTLSVASSHVR